MLLHVLLVVGLVAVATIWNNGQGSGNNGNNGNNDFNHGQGSGNGEAEIPKLITAKGWVKWDNDETQRLSKLCRTDVEMRTIED